MDADGHGVRRALVADEVDDALGELVVQLMLGVEVGQRLHETPGS